MSSDSESERDPWDVFETALGRAEEDLDTARTRYEGLGDLNASPPDSFASALRELESDIDAIDDVLDVTEADATEAEAVAERASLLADVLDASWQFETALVRTRLDIYETWTDQLAAHAGEQIDTIYRDIEALREFADNDNYGQFYTGSRFTIANVRNQLYAVDEDVRTSFSLDDYVSYCLEAVEVFEEAFTDDVKQLVAADASISIKQERLAIKDRVEDFRTADEGDTLGETAPMEARTALEGAMMLKYQTAYAVHGHTYRERLVERVADIEDVEESIVDGLGECDIGDLERTIEQVVIGETTRSTEERIVDLIREHDGSVERALAASDLDMDEFFAALQTAFVDGPVTDLEARFE